MPHTGQWSSLQHPGPQSAGRDCGYTPEPELQTIISANGSWKAEHWGNAVLSSLMGKDSAWGEGNAYHPQLPLILQHDVELSLQ